MDQKLFMGAGFFVLDNDPSQQQTLVKKVYPMKISPHLPKMCLCMLFSAKVKLTFPFCNLMFCSVQCHLS